MFRAITVAMAGLLPAPVAADDAKIVPTEGPVLVAEVIDAETLRLADGRVLRLAGIIVPLSGADDRYAEVARQALALLARDRQVVFAFGARRMD
ncbi:MAG: hypothetical protein ACREEV_13950, partial [Dongiaceae bacterium]